MQVYAYVAKALWRLQARFNEEDDNRFVPKALKSTALTQSASPYLTVNRTRLPYIDDAYKEKNHSRIECAGPF